MLKSLISELRKKIKMAEEAILGYLAKNEEIGDSGEFAAKHGLNHDEVVNVIKSLHGFRYVEAQVLYLYSKPNCHFSLCNFMHAVDSINVNGMPKFVSYRFFRITVHQSSNVF